MIAGTFIYSLLSSASISDNVGDVLSCCCCQSDSSSIPGHTLRDVVPASRKTVHGNPMLLKKLGNASFMRHLITTAESRRSGSHTNNDDPHALASEGASASPMARLNAMTIGCLAF